MYNIKAAAKILDMPKVTIRSWETRYNAITPARTETGHRLYSDQNLEDLKWLKIQVQKNGIKISEAVKQLHSSKRKPSEKVTVPSDFDAQTYDKQVHELYMAASELDTERFNYLLDLHFSLFHYRTVFFSIIVPLMVRVGKEWGNGSMSVAHEHLISHIIQQRFTQFFRVFPTSSELPKVMSLCPSGEFHQLGLMLFTLFLREKGYPVVFLGADTPLDGLSEIVAQQDIRIVAMATTTPSSLPVVERYIADIGAANPDVHFMVGGRGIVEPMTTENVSFIGPLYESWQEELDRLRKHPLSQA